MKITINKLAKSQIEIIGSMEVSEFAKYEDKAIQRLGDRLEVDGFRKGKAPVEVVKKQVTDMMILEEMAEMALYDAYPKIIVDNKIDAIGRPQIAITKIARGSDLEFKIHTAVLPEVKLPDYVTLSKEIKEKNPKEEVIINEAEVEKTILGLRKMRAEQAHIKHEHEDADATDHAHEEIPESDYPVFDDKFAKSFGDFPAASALTEKIRSNLKMEKEVAAKDKIRLMIVEKLLAESELEVPEVLIEAEVEKIYYKLQADISGMGFSVEDYLTQVNKTEEDIKLEWRPEAEKRAKLEMIIHAISQKDNLKPTDEEVEKEVENIMTMYKDADPVLARAYIENMLGNEKVFAFLEK
ncbi:MAG: trigger factor [bacterium]